ncbi:putative Kinesin-related protein 1 [Paratrimastix pyriformis]|uniref:Kinesin-related protein 1 n=1 Tax=Paratrimastix pyriformis TaxID=342808 RepID=A0ABQ8UPZ6_9EUKA|nr:putative Kinesin-related protein 1 [Paratrimastix pyriformis]
MADTVHVAVRMRPLNQRELDLGAALCLKMDGPTTELIAADGSKKTFNFDFSFDSLDSAHPIHDQAFIFEKLGKQFILEKAWQGYNCTLFAYGQTGSGKSFSMTGGKSPDSRGLIPRTCEEMFNRIASQAGPTEQFEVSCQFLEIYNERLGPPTVPFPVRPLLSPILLQLRDLFNIKSQTEPRIREDPKKGVFVEPAIRERVSSYAEVEAKMEAGTKARVVAATKMNATSSRSHSVFTIYFKRIMVTAGSAKVKESCISLVDLAGSERQAKTGAEGQRLAEACAINTSLSALGNVISALAENSVPGAKPKFVPYRDSVLTRLLQNGLGGNSQTVMIAALSPAMDNYEETMSTLKYADRAKRIVNVAKINENPADKQLREMQELIAALQKQLQDRPAGASADPASQAEMDRLKEELDTRNKMLTDLQVAARSHAPARLLLLRSIGTFALMTSEEQARAAEENRKKRDEALKAITPHHTPSHLQANTDHHAHKASHTSSLAYKPAHVQDSGIATGEMLAMLGSSNTPYLTNLSPDPSLTNALVYLIDKRPFGRPVPTGTPVSHAAATPPRIRQALTGIHQRPHISAT